MKRVVTHSGNFHADELLALATLKLALSEPLETLRSRDSEVWKTADFVVDVGGEYNPSEGRFDHHQEGGAGKRGNGISYSSFGIVWKEYGKEAMKTIARQENLSVSEDIILAAAANFDERIVAAIDAGDTGVEQRFEGVRGVSPYTLDDVVKSFYPRGSHTSEEYDTEFFVALPFIEKILSGEIYRALFRALSASVAQAVYRSSEDKRILVFEKNCDWSEEIMKYPEPIFVVYFREEAGNWGINTVRAGKDSDVRRKYFPLSWAAKRDEELSKVSGVSEAIFCHSGRHFCVAQNKQGALFLAKEALHSKE